MHTSIPIEENNLSLSVPKSKLNAKRHSSLITNLPFDLNRQHSLNENDILNNFGFFFQLSAKDGDIFDKITRKQINDIKSAKYYDEFSALHLAAKNCNRFLCEKLIEVVGIEVNIESNRKVTPLHLLIAYNGNKKHVVSPDNSSCVVPFFAISEDYKQTECLEYLIRMKANVKAKDKSGLTPFHYAAIKDNRKAAEYIINNCTSEIFYGKDKQSVSALHLACKFGNFSIADLIIEKMNPTDLIDQSESLENLNDYFEWINKSNKTLPLHSAAAYNNMEKNYDKMESTVKKMLYKLREADLLYQALDSRDQNNDTLLHIAIKNNNISLVKTLITEFNNKIDVEGGPDSFTPLQLTAQLGSIEIFDFLLENNANIDEVNIRNENALHVAATYNKPQFIKHFLNKEYEINKHYSCYDDKNSQQFTPIMCATFYGHINCIDVFHCRFKSKLNFILKDRDNYDRTIFHLCARKNHFDCFKYFLDLIEDIYDKKDILKQKDNRDNTVLHYACKYGNYDIVKYIFLFIDINSSLVFIKNNDEQTAFHVACKKGTADIINYILEKIGENSHLLLKDKDINLNTPLHLACLNDNENIVTILLKHGADVNARNIQNLTALDISCNKGNLTLSKLLIEHKSPINSANPNERVNLPIHLACRSGNKNLVKYLIGSGADLSVLNEKEENVLDIAIKKGHRDIVETLLQLDNYYVLINLEKEKYNSRFKSLNEKMPDMTMILINKMIINKDTQIYNFSSMDPSFKAIENVENHPLYILSKTESEDLLMHEALSELVKIKWNRFPQKVYYANLATYITFLCFLTYHIRNTIRYEDYLESEATLTHLNYELLDRPSIISIILLFLNIIFLVLHATKELFQILSKGFSYIKALDNILELNTYVLSMIFLTPWIYLTTDHDGEDILYVKTEFQMRLSSLCSISSWMILVLFIQMLPSIGIYSVMLRKILAKSLSLLPIFIIMIYGFSMAFTLDKGERLVGENSTTTFVSILKTMEMLVGELNSESLKYEEFITKQIGFFFFLGIMCVMLLNLLIGISVGEIRMLHEEADVKRICMKIKFVLRVQETFFQLFKTDQFMTFKDNIKIKNKQNNKKTNIFKKKFEEILELKDITERRSFNKAEHRLNDLFKKLIEINEKIEILSSQFDKS